MDAAYSAAHSFPVLTHTQWSEDIKPGFSLSRSDQSRSSSSLNSTVSLDSSSVADGRQTNLKVEDDMQASEQMWHNRLHDQYAEQSAFPPSHAMNGHGPQTFRMSDSNMIHMPTAAPWPASQSGSSTPTPIYGHPDGFGQIPYVPVGSVYSFSQDPNAAIPMSPQSSQEGWASAASSDGIDQTGMMQSPLYRPSSPSLVVRSDGIRKKNARFEIPKDRNLSNIDAMIQQTTDENEKKELKQQKRLLRNRQAALDSRQRKKTHTEKLEQEKKVSEKKMFDLEEAFARMENTLSIEREQWMQQRQQMDQYIRAVSYERDEAIRTKTLETAELRHQNNVLKDMVRDLEHQQHQPCPSSDINAYPSSFNEYAVEDHYNEDYPFMNHHKDDDYDMEGADHMQRQTTPRPPPTQPVIDNKAEGFSWNTFYMCLLFGAFLAANGKSVSPENTTTSAIASSISPAEAGNVLKAVLKRSEPDLMPTNGLNQAGRNQALNHVIQPMLGDGDSEDVAPSTLESLHEALSTPSRRQMLQSAFSLPPSSYSHIVDPFNEHLNTEPESAPLVHQPSQIQLAVAEMKAQKDEMERANGIGAKLRERSQLWDQLSPKVIRDFQDLVRSNGGMSHEHGSE